MVLHDYVRVREAPDTPDDFEEPTMKVDQAWHLDKKVPLGLMAAIIVQTITLVYVGTTWKSDVDHRLVVLEKSDDQKRPQETRIIIVEQQLKFIAESLQRIESKIDSNQRLNSRP